MNCAGRTIQRATWTTGGTAGPGGNEGRMCRRYRCAIVHPMRGGPLDHVALWTDERDALADFLTERAGMHVIEKTDTFTLVGADAKLGKITLFEAEGPRDPGVLCKVGLNVHDDSLAGQVDAPGGLTIEFVDHRAGAEWDLNHVELRVPDPSLAADEMRRLGFE